MLKGNIDILKLRFNTESNGTDLCWRLLFGGKEYLVNHICIETPCSTSKDWLEDKEAFKHHITIKNCRIKIDDDLVATITSAE